MTSTDPTSGVSSAPATLPLKKKGGSQAVESQPAIVPHTSLDDSGPLHDPPPLDLAEEEGEDELHFHRGYELDVFGAQPSVAPTYSQMMFGGKPSGLGTARTKSTAPQTRNNTNNNFPASGADDNASSVGDTGDGARESAGPIDTVSALREDTQSVASLELPSQAARRDSDAGGTDSQSVSSMEFGATESCPKGSASADSKSLNSLDWKLDGEGGTEQGESKEDASFNHSTSQMPGFVSTSSLRPLGDRYNLDDEPPPTDCDRHASEWGRCLHHCCQMIQDANTVFNSISSSVVCAQVIRSMEGSSYVTGVIELYRVSCRIMAAMNAFNISSSNLEKVLKDIDIAWNNLTAFFVGASVLPEPGLLQFGHAVLKSDGREAQQQACGVCLLSVDWRLPATAGDDMAKLTYGGRQYHAPCANFWVNCVDSTLPSLRIPELL